MSFGIYFVYIKNILDSQLPPYYTYVRQPTAKKRYPECILSKIDPLLRFDPRNAWLPSANVCRGSFFQQTYKNFRFVFPSLPKPQCSSNLSARSPNVTRT